MGYKRGGYKPMKPTTKKEVFTWSSVYLIAFTIAIILIIYAKPLLEDKSGQLLSFKEDNKKNKTAIAAMDILDHKKANKEEKEKQISGRSKTVTLLILDTEEKADNTEIRIDDTINNSTTFSNSIEKQKKSKEKNPF